MTIPQIAPVIARDKDIAMTERPAIIMIMSFELVITIPITS
jgi:hypothetical protein